MEWARVGVSPRVVVRFRWDSAFGWGVLGVWGVCMLGLVRIRSAPPSVGRAAQRICLTLSLLQYARLCGHENMKGNLLWYLP